ncbi:MAG: class I SAM-dependent methyltransferase [Desulfatibacillaceae bacterium]|nr:class I SAM-dependent methyltransferase [Desulfatibacillaceae bacterium]
MSLFSMVKDSTKPYTRLESKFYDHFIAPTVAGFYSHFEQALGLMDGMDDAFVLDVGCGGGQLLEYIAKRRPNARGLGVDLSSDQIRRAKKRLAPYGSRMSAITASALDMPLPDNEFDLVVSIGCIKHWPDRLKGLVECVRVLKPGSRLLVVEADRGCRLEDVAYLAQKTPLPFFAKPIFRIFYLVKVAGPSLDMEEMRELAKKLPLKKVRVSRVPGLPGLMLDAIKK